MENKLPYEIHITIDAKDFNNFSIDSFVKDCESIKVKPIVLDLEINNNSSIKDVMTSSRYSGDDKGAYLESERISKALSDMNYVVVRKKIETCPWHKMAPQKYDNMPKDCYFESHLGVKLKVSDKEKLQKCIDSLNYLQNEKIRLSRNFFKKVNNEGYYINMVTFRSYILGSGDFEEKVNHIKNTLNNEGFDIEKVEVEFAIYDSKISHDYMWLNG